jgi:hypothetical protein
MGVIYAFVDTCVLSDILRQYDPKNPHELLSGGQNLKKGMLKVVNDIIGDEEENGYIIASTFAFVELINKLDKCFSGSVSIERLLSIMEQPPSWLIIEDIRKETALNFCDVPIAVDGENVSSDDAIHVATALQRGDDIIFLTTDHILSKMNLPKITFINN